MSGCGGSSGNQADSHDMGNTVNNAANDSSENNRTSAAGLNRMNSNTPLYAPNHTPFFGYDMVPTPQAPQAPQAPLYHVYSMDAGNGPYPAVNMRPMAQPMHANPVPNPTIINIPYQHDLDKAPQPISSISSTSSLNVAQPQNYLNGNIMSSYPQPHKIPSMNQQMPQNPQHNNILQHQNVSVESNISPHPLGQQITFGNYPQEAEYYVTDIRQFQQQQQQQQSQLPQQQQSQLPQRHQGQQTNVMQQSYPVQIDPLAQVPQIDYYRSPSVNINIVQKNSVGKPFSMIDAGTNRGVKLDYAKVDRLAYEISQNMVVPPFSTLKPSKSSMKTQKPKRSKRRSKFTQEQDLMIINMKKENKTWVEIAECAKVDSYLAARNRYQVLIGQQGGGTGECGPEDVLVLKNIVDDGEVEKMKYLSKEFRKCTGKQCSYKQVRELIRYLFWKNTGKFDVGASYLQELERLQKQRHEELGGEGREEDGLRSSSDESSLGKEVSFNNSERNIIETNTSPERKSPEN